MNLRCLFSAVALIAAAGGVLRSANAANEIMVVVEQWGFNGAWDQARTGTVVRARVPR